MSRRVPCPTCRELGFVEVDGERQACPECHGDGMVDAPLAWAPEDATGEAQEDAMPDDTFPTAPVRVALTKDESDPLHFFRSALAAALPPERMHFAAFAFQARLLLVTKPGALAGYSPIIYALIENSLKDIARDVLPAEAAEGAVKMIEATR